LKEAMPSSLLAKPYPTAEEWRKLVQQFSPEAIAHRFLLAHIPYVFRDEARLKKEFDEQAKKSGEGENDAKK
jgi:hypothetical protein